MDFYEGQVVTVLEGCHDEEDDYECYTWGGSMSVFCGHKYIIHSIDMDDHHIYLRETEESEGITVEGCDVTYFYFCEYWLAPYEEKPIVESDALIEFFDNF